MCLNGLPLSPGVRDGFGNEVIIVFSPNDVPRQTLLQLPTARWPCPSTPMSGRCPEKQPVSAARSSVGARPGSKRQGDHLTEQHPTCGGSEEERTRGWELGVTSVHVPLCTREFESMTF